MIRNDSRRHDATKAIECRKFSVAFPSLMFLLWIAVSSPSELRKSTCWNLHHKLREMNSPPNNNLEWPPISEGSDAGKWSWNGVVVDASRRMLILAWAADLRYRGSIRTDSAEQPPRTAHRYRHRYGTAIRGACIGGGTSLERYYNLSFALFQ